MLCRIRDQREKDIQINERKMNADRGMNETFIHNDI